MVDHHDERMITRVAGGAAIGAVAGALIGLAIHLARGDGGILTSFEIVGALVGIVVGGAMGAFYGGALRLPRHRS